jgi:hypothetical protein
MLFLFFIAGYVSGRTQLVSITAVGAVFLLWMALSNRREKSKEIRRLDERMRDAAADVYDIRAKTFVAFKGIRCRSSRFSGDFWSVFRR